MTKLVCNTGHYIDTSFWDHQYFVISFSFQPVLVVLFKLPGCSHVNQKRHGKRPTLAMVIDNWCNHLGVCTINLPWEVLKRKSSDPWCMSYIWAFKFAPGVSLASPKLRFQEELSCPPHPAVWTRVWISQFWSAKTCDSKNSPQRLFRFVGFSSWSFWLYFNYIILYLHIGGKGFWMPTHQTRHRTKTSKHEKIWLIVEKII